MTKSIFVAFLAAIITTNTVQAMSCSEYRGVCMVKAVNKKLCAGAWNRCMKSGIYIGPESGTNHGQAERR